MVRSPSATDRSGFPSFGHHGGSGFGGSGSGFGGSGYGEFPGYHGFPDHHLICKKTVIIIPKWSHASWGRGGFHGYHGGYIKKIVIICYRPISSIALSVVITSPR